MRKPSSKFVYPTRQHALEWGTYRGIDKEIVAEI